MYQCTLASENKQTVKVRWTGWPCINYYSGSHNPICVFKHC